MEKEFRIFFGRLNRLTKNHHTRSRLIQTMDDMQFFTKVFFVNFYKAILNKLRMLDFRVIGMSIKAIGLINRHDVFIFK
ncbi:hypothetical protein D3C87_1097350 [compost metagenome]